MAIQPGQADACRRGQDWTCRWVCRVSTFLMRAMACQLITTANGLPVNAPGAAESVIGGPAVPGAGAGARRVIL